VNKPQVFSIRVILQPVTYSSQILIQIQPISLVLVLPHKYLFSKKTNLKKNLKNINPFLTSLIPSLKINNNKQINPLLALIKPKLISRLLRHPTLNFHKANNQAINLMKPIKFCKKKINSIHFWKSNKALRIRTKNLNKIYSNNNLMQILKIIEVFFKRQTLFKLLPKTTNQSFLIITQI
jgi:hypothetical protein